jgi:rubrerythrin
LAVTSDSAKIADVLERIARGEHAHVFATRAALARSEESNHRSLLGEIAEHHLRYANDLSELLASVDRERRIKRRLSSDWARVLASAFVSEKALLKAVRANEERSLREYERMLREASAPNAAGKILHKLVEKGHEHIAQIDEAISAWISTGEHRSPPEPLQSGANAAIHRA